MLVVIVPTVGNLESIGGAGQTNDTLLFNLHFSNWTQRTSKIFSFTLSAKVTKMSKRKWTIGNSQLLQYKVV